MSHGETTHAELKRQVRWLRGLARELVRDEHLAEDLAQETLLEALARPPRSLASLRQWMRSVVRNRWRDTLRSDERRRQRETVAARPEATDDGAADVALVELQRTLAQAVLELEEPYRSALVLRFYESLPPREIARRQGASVATVKSRLRRALERLRQTLDQRRGGRSNWSAVLAPWAFARRSPLNPSVELGGTLVAAKLIVFGALTLTLASAWWMLSRGGEAQIDSARVSRPSEPLDASVVTQGQPGERRATAGAPQGALGELARSSHLAEEVSQDARAATTVVGRVLDQFGLGLANARVRVAPGGEQAVSDAAGRFQLETRDEAGTVRADDARWVEVRTGAWRRDSGVEPVLILAPRVDLAGEVRDESGAAVPDARVTLSAPQGFEARFEVELAGTQQPQWTATSDVDGRFELRGAPALEGGELRVAALGFEALVLPAPTRDEPSMQLELRRVAAARRLLRGRVVRADGWPAEDALVSFGERATRVDRSGEFAFELTESSTARRLTAVAPGQLPAEHEFESAPRAATESEFVELRLGGAALSITGRVVDENGAPRAGGRVWALDTENFGLLGSVPLQLEALLAGAPIPAAAIESQADAQRGRDYHSARPQTAPDALLSWTTTDEHGHFELGGLLPRSYRLAALEPQLRWGAMSESISAGERGVVLVASSEALYPLVRGRVVDQRGRPVSAATVLPWVSAFSARLDLGGRRSHVSRFFTGAPVRTDELGRFELRDVLRERLNFMVEGDAITPTYTSIEQLRDPLEFEIRVAARAQLEIVAAPESITAVRALDEHGRVVELLELRADGYSNYERFELTGGRSGVLSVGTHACLLELWAGDELRERVALDLRAGERVSITR